MLITILALKHSHKKIGTRLVNSVLNDVLCIVIRYLPLCPNKILPDLLKHSVTYEQAQNETWNTTRICQQSMVLCLWPAPDL